MTDLLVDILRQYPTIALFLTVGLGFLLGKIRIGTFTVGSVTAVLVVGVLVGQLDIPVSGPIKMFFFMLFLFSIGYSVGPDFFKSLRGGGARQALFAVVMGIVICFTTLVMAMIMGYGKGVTVGMFSGSQTCSALLGIGGEAISRLPLDAEEIKAQSDVIPVCYAVTYVFGTLGTVIILGTFGPRLLGGVEKVKRRTQQLEKELNDTVTTNDPASINAMRAVSYRVFRIENPWFDTPRCVSEIEDYLARNGKEVYVDCVRTPQGISAAHHDTKIAIGDSIVICGRREEMLQADHLLGIEVNDTEMLSYPLERVAVRVTKNGFIGKLISDLRQCHYMHGVVIRDAIRDGRKLPIDRETTFAKGDRITIMGRPGHVIRAAKEIGHLDRPSISTDLMFVGLAIAIGGIFGALSLLVGSIPISLGTSGGALVAGLVFGWLRSLRPTFGNIPSGALWLMNNLGLNVFIAVIGIQSGPSFVSGIEAVGPMLFVAGAIATTLPLLIGIWVGDKIFKFNPAITLGCLAGTRTCTASLGAVQNTLGSTIPAIGYTVTYAVSNILLVVWGMLAVIII